MFPISSWLRITPDTNSATFYSLYLNTFQNHSSQSWPVRVCERKMGCVWATETGMKQTESDSGVQERRVAETYWKRAGLFLSRLSTWEVLSEEVYLFSSRNGKWRVIWREPRRNYTGDCCVDGVSRDYSFPLSAVLISRRELLLDVSQIVALP